MIAEAAVNGSSVTKAVEAFLGRGLRSLEAQSVLEALDQITKLIRIEREEQAAYARELPESEVVASSNDNSGTEIRSGVGIRLQ